MGTKIGGKHEVSLKDRRNKLIAELREKYKLNSPKVLWAISQVPREKFIPTRYRKFAYSNNPLPIGYGQTISQPFTVAFMTSLLSLEGKEKVLEIGTGSGYQAAVLSLLSRRIYSIERIGGLVKKASERLKKLGYSNVTVIEGQGEEGWGKEAPYDAIIATAGMETVPHKLIDQLKVGGRMVAPVGEGVDKTMLKLVKLKDAVVKEEHGIFRFVPFIEE